MAIWYLKVRSRAEKAWSRLHRLSVDLSRLWRGPETLCWNIIPAIEASLEVQIR